MGEETMLEQALAGTVLDRGQRASHQVYDLLRKAIVSLRLEPNQPISEQEVASVLSLSRTPVREAFIRLAEEGLLISYPQLATVISPIRMDAIFEAQFLREAVESAIAERAAENIDAIGTARLEGAYEAHRIAWEAGNWSEFYHWDEMTHQIVAEIAGLTGVFKHLEPARAQLDRMRHVVLPERDTAIRVINQHREFITAICEGRGEQARAAMARHTRDILTRLPDLRQRRPELFEERPVMRSSTARR
ncbi:GntR family transcriptional regulator [Devosia honganensis]|uniref:GntR family transcriptional regulator n=1 Tax=Devosia honganensis TaxID=1610527 RepID=A0ABV7X3Y8_9HYPH